MARILMSAGDRTVRCGYCRLYGHNIRSHLKRQDGIVVDIKYLEGPKPKYKGGHLDPEYCRERGHCVCPRPDGYRSSIRKK